MRMRRKCVAVPKFIRIKRTGGVLGRRQGFKHMGVRVLPFEKIAGEGKGWVILGDILQSPAMPDEARTCGCYEQQCAW